ncbi:MFS transporter [Bacillus thuringiensis]|uniref:MFS transporter n=1 Tax=Bacillus thuringiensis TaxID=1428 RepID=UPI003337F541
MKKQTLQRTKVVLYSEAIFSLEIFFAPIMIAFYLNYIGLSFGEMSLLFSISLVSGWILEIPSGAFSDWFGRKKAFLLGKFIYLIGMLSLFIVKDFEYLIIVAIILSVGLSTGSGNLPSIVYENLDSVGIEKEVFFRISSQANSFAFLSSAIASIVGGYLGSIDLRIPLVIDCIFIILTISISYIFVEEKSQSYLLKSNEGFNFKIVLIDIFKLIKDGFLLSIKNQNLLFIFLVSALSFSVLRTGFNFYQPIFEEFSVNLEMFGIILAVLNIIAAAVSYFAGKIPKKFIQNQSLIIISGFLLILSGILAYWNFGMVMFIGIAFTIHQVIRGFVNPYISYAVNKEIPKESKNRTTVLSFDFLMRALFGTFIMTLSGMISETYGLLKGFSILSIIVGAIILSIYVTFKSMSKRKQLKESPIVIDNH